MKLDGMIAAITGAGSGIGRALALELAARGNDLAISDVDEVGLAETERRCATHGVVISRSIVDVADRAAVESWAGFVVERHGGINLIVNNAGVAMVAPAADQPIDDFGWLMGINFWGVVHGTQAFLPHLAASGEGHIVNISSVFGLMSIPSQAAYNASKFAVRGYSDTVRMELEMAGSPVSVTTVHPGGIKTAIARNAAERTSTGSVDSNVVGTSDPHPRTSTGSVDSNVVGTSDPHPRTSTGSVDSNIAERFEKHLARTSPEKAARQILRAVERNRRRALIGPDAPLFDLVARLPASLSQRITMTAARLTLDD